MVMNQEALALEPSECKKKRATALDVAKIVGCSETTIFKAYQHPDQISKDKAEKIKLVAAQIGYEMVDKYQHIPKQFLTGQKNIYGTPEYNEPLLVELKREGKSVRQISYLSGISVQCLSKIFRKNDISILNTNHIPLNGISKRKLIALRVLEKCQVKVRNSDIRKTLAKIIRGFRDGGAIETLAYEAGVNKSIIWNYLKNSFAYNYLNAKRIRKCSGERERHEAPLKSKKYKYEKHMTEAAYDYLNQLYPINKIYPEELIYKTGTSNKGRGGFTCDFLIKDTNEIFEVKQRTTTSSNKTLYGQIFVYQSQGYKVNVILPDDVLVADSMRHILSKNNVDIHLIP